MWLMPWKKLRRALIGLFVFGGLSAVILYTAGRRQGLQTGLSPSDKIGRLVNTVPNRHSSDSVNQRVSWDEAQDAAGNPVNNSQTPQCEMKKNLAFVKINRAGSHTAACVLQRFGYEQRLNFVLPKKCPSISLGFPGGITDDLLLDQNVDEYNLLVHHSVYNRTTFRRLMAPDTRFVAILRQPLSHLKSCFFYFGIDRRTGLAIEKNPLGAYLDKPWLYEDSPIAKKLKFTMTKNFQAYVLGWKDRYNQDREEVEKFIWQIHGEFTMVLILEYLDASLVLLKRLMCWTFYNILYDKQPRNQQIYDKPEFAYTDQQVKNHRDSNWIDYQLYEHFNTSLWRQIQAAGPDFHQEVAAFQQLNDDVNNYCAERSTGRKFFPGTKWSGPVEIGPEFCKELQMERKQWDIKICHRAGAYSEGEMHRKEASFLDSKAKLKSGRAKRPLSKPETDQFLAKMKKSFGGIDMAAMLKKNNVSANRLIKAIQQGQYSVDEAVQALKYLMYVKKH